MKLDTMSSQGIFMTYSGTDKNVYVVNQDGTNERLTTHVSYDEAHMSSNKPTLPPMAITLQQKGYGVCHILNFEMDVSYNCTDKMNQEVNGFL